MQATLLNNLLKELVRHIAGKNSETLVDILNEKTVNEFKIADRMKLTVNQVRNIFYKLHSYDVVIASRKKDKRKGWYIYSWTINIPKSLEVLRDFKQKQIFEIEHTIKSRESKRFYLCPSCNIEMAEESALNHDFFCPECGKLLQLSSSDAFVREQKQKLEHVKKELVILEEEIGKMLASKIKKIGKFSASKKAKLLAMKKKAHKPKKKSKVKKIREFSGSRKAKLFATKKTAKKKQKKSLGSKSKKSKISKKKRKK
jgi:transcription initiation factor TFIIE subunit alpha